MVEPLSPVGNSPKVYEGVVESGATVVGGDTGLGEAPKA